MHLNSGPQKRLAVTPDSQTSDEDVTSERSPVAYNDEEDSDEGSTLIPKQLAQQTRRTVNAFGLFQFLWPIVAACLTDNLSIDIFALMIATNGRRITRSSFRQFPWTAVMCGVYPVVFVVSLWFFDASQPSSWFPSRNSPVLLLQFASSCWAIWAIVLIARCHSSHRVHFGTMQRIT